MAIIPPNDVISNVMSLAALRYSQLVAVIWRDTIPQRLRARIGSPEHKGRRNDNGKCAHKPNENNMGDGGQMRMHERGEMAVAVR